jgi:SRSO17 transposase
MVGSGDAWLIVDDKALPKKGERSVGVAPQRAGSVCQLCAISDLRGTGL